MSKERDKGGLGRNKCAKSKKQGKPAARVMEGRGASHAVIFGLPDMGPPNIYDSFLIGTPWGWVIHYSILNSVQAPSLSQAALDMVGCSLPSNTGAAL